MIDKHNKVMYNNKCVTDDAELNIGRDVVQNMEKYSSGWRGAPAKGVGRLRGARVQIPLSPFYQYFEFLWKIKNLKKVVDKGYLMWYSIKVADATQKEMCKAYFQAIRKNQNEPWQINNNATLKILEE